MVLEEIFAASIGRALSREEEELLQLLSPQGMAKVNSDVSQGANLKLTLVHLKIAFHESKRRMSQVKRLVPEGMLPVVSQMSRSPTSEEMVLLSDVSVSTLQRIINRRTKTGEALEDVLQELAEGHRQWLLQCRAKQLLEMEGRPVFMTPLSPTQLN
eukprot:RCo054235